jgi:hypothetical protein
MPDYVLSERLQLVMVLFLTYGTEKPYANDGMPEKS